MRQINRVFQRPVALITGASAGVGRAAARRFAQGGYDVALLARGRAGLSAAADEVARFGRRAFPIPCDVSDAEAVDQAATRAENELGELDVWVNNAMTSVISPVVEMKPDEFKRVTEVTYLGYVYGTLAALKRMRPRNRGSIIQVGSALAYRSIPLQSAYCAAKHAIVGFTDSLRCELLHEHSQLNLTAVHLPAVNTPQFDWTRSRLPKQSQPVPPIYQPEVAAEAIYMAAHQRRREWWVGRSSVLSILANRVAPGLLDRCLASTGYQAQQTDSDPRPGGADNLNVPLDDDDGRDFGAHGSFYARAESTSPLLAASKHRRAIGWLATAAAGVAVAALVGRQVSQR